MTAPIASAPTAMPPATSVGASSARQGHPDDRGAGFQDALRASTARSGERVQGGASATDETEQRPAAQSGEIHVKRHTVSSSDTGSAGTKNDDDNDSNDRDDTDGQSSAVLMLHHLLAWHHGAVNDHGADGSDRAGESGAPSGSDANASKGLADIATSGTKAGATIAAAAFHRPGGTQSPAAGKTGATAGDAVDKAVQETMAPADGANGSASNTSVDTDVAPSGPRDAVARMVEVLSPAASVSSRAMQQGEATDAGKAKQVGADRSQLHSNSPAGAAVPDDPSAVTSVEGDAGDGQSMDTGPGMKKSPGETLHTRAATQPVQATSGGQTAPTVASHASMSATSAALADAITTNTDWREIARHLSSLPTDQRAAAGIPVQALDIQLQPAELGMVQARLTRSGDHLAVELRVGTDEAHRRLSSDKDAIVKAMQGLGLEVDRVVIHAPSNASAGHQATASGGRDSTSSMNNPNNRDAGNGSGSRNNPDGGRGRGTEQNSGRGESTPGARRGVYI